MRIDTDVFAAVTERVDRIEADVAELAARVADATTAEAILRRAAMPAAALVYGTRTGRPRHARDRHLRVVRDGDRR
jgi:hypothetical protein